MRLRYFVYCFVLLFGFEADAAVLRFVGPDSVVTILSIQKKKATFLNVDELTSRLPVTIRRDDDTGLTILCTELNCIAIFPMDKDNYFLRDTTDYVRLERVAEVMGYTVRKKRDEFELTCANTCASFPVGSGVGEHAPGFQLVGRNDSLETLVGLRASGPVVVAFIRSGDWDPLTRLLLFRLNAALPTFDSLGTHVVAIHGYGKKMSGRWQDTLKVNVPLFSDDNSAVMRAYDVFDRGTLPHPTAFVIDQEGIIRFRENYEQLEVPPNLAPLIEAVKKTRK